jgi:hypothetical protein
MDYDDLKGILNPHMENLDVSFRLRISRRTLTRLHQVALREETTVSHLLREAARKLLAQRDRAAATQNTP